MPSTIDDVSARRARDHIATLALSMYQIRGLPAPGSDELGNLVARAEAAMSLQQMRHPDSIGASAIGQIDQLVLGAAEAKRRPVNLYGAEAPASGKDGSVLDRTRGGDLFERLRTGGSYEREATVRESSDRSGSGARFDDLSSGDWGSPAGLARMRDYAIQTGLPWAANSPELLRLGPAAIGALAAVQFKQETYKSLTTDASFKAKDVVSLARFAKEQHVDANTLGISVAKVEKDMTPQERARFNGAVVPYMADPKNPERQAKANKAFDEAEKAHPEKHQKLETLREQFKLKGQTLDHAKDAAAAKDSRADAKDRSADSKDQRADTKTQIAAQSGARQEDKLAAFDALGSEADKPTVPASKNDKTKAAAPMPSAPPTKSSPQKSAAPAPH